MDLGRKIKERRTLLMLTQEELANRCELTKGYISQLENNKVSPSIETLELILEVLGINLSEFFKEDSIQQLVFTQEDQNEKEFDGYHQVWLVPTAQNHQMEPIYVELEPKASTFKDYPHVGEEFGYVLEGEILLIFGDSKQKIKAGESFYLNASKTHYIENIGTIPAKVIWVSTPPNF